MIDAPRGRIRAVVVRLAALATSVAFSAACGGGGTGVTPPGATLTLGVSLDYVQGPFTAGQAYFGRNGYIEYIAGNSAVIYTAPHGGALLPDEMPDRTSASCGESIVTSADLNTADLVRRMQQAHVARHGTYPHVVINHLHRRRLDANRTRAAGACGDAEAEIAWQEWHDFIGIARNAVVAAGRGWYMDMHGHGHDKQRLELGYLTTGAQLRLDEGTLDATAAYENTSSVSTLSKHSPLGFSALLRGSSALGTLYASNAFPAVPSTSDPAPAIDDEYFSGGYNTARYGCGAEATALGGTSGGSICGVQVEANFTGVRDTQANRQRFAEVTALVVDQYLGTHWGLELGSASSGTVPAARLTWSGSTALSIDIYRNGARIGTVANTGAYTHTLAVASGTYTYRVCEAGTSVCSNDASMTF